MKIVFNRVERSYSVSAYNLLLNDVDVGRLTMSDQKFIEFKAIIRQGLSDEDRLIVQGVGT